MDAAHAVAQETRKLLFSFSLVLVAFVLHLYLVSAEYDKLGNLGGNESRLASNIVVVMV